MKLFKTFFSTSLILIAAFSSTACSDEELSFGAGVVVGVIIGDDSGSHHRHRRNPPRYRRGGRRWHSTTETVALSPSQTVALKYNLSADQADILTAHLLPAQKGDLSGLAALGFEKQDLQALVAGQNPSASTLMTLSEKLSLDMSEAHQLIQDIKADAITARDSMM